jgi:hypothetical protein
LDRRKESVEDPDVFWVRKRLRPDLLSPFEKEEGSTMILVRLNKRSLVPEAVRRGAFS